MHTHRRSRILEVGVQMMWYITTYNTTPIFLQLKSNMQVIGCWFVPQEAIVFCVMKN